MIRQSALNRVAGSAAAFLILLEPLSPLLIAASPIDDPVTECVEHFPVDYGREQALRMSSENPDRLLSWARRDYGRLEVWTAVTRLEGYLERGPASAVIYLDLALAYLTYGRFDSAIEILERGRREAPDSSRFAPFIETFISDARSVKYALTEARDSLHAQGMDVSYPDERIFAVALAADLPAQPEHYFRILNIADAWVSAFPESSLALQQLADLNLAFAAEISGGTNVPQVRGNVAVHRATHALDKLQRLDSSNTFPALRMNQYLLRTRFLFGRNQVRNGLPDVVATALKGLDENPNYTEKQKAFLRYGQAMFRLQQPTWAVPHMPKLIIESLEDAVRRDADTAVYSGTLAWFRANADDINRRKRRAHAIDDARARQLAQQAFAPAGARTPTGTTAGARLYFDLLQGIWDANVDEIARESPMMGRLMKQLGCVACWGSGTTFFGGESCPACEGSGGK